MHVDSGFDAREKHQSLIPAIQLLVALGFQPLTHRGRDHGFDLEDAHEAMLGQKLAEDRWQAFFNENPSILNMVFGYPVIKVRDQASVGGRKLSGGGGKITDFLVKNSLTNNPAVFEIKTSHTPVLNKTPFRDGVYTPSSDLSGSINQALDQKDQFQKQIVRIKDNTRLHDIETCAVHCCLVVGRTPDGENRMKSFGLFRRHSRDVEIVTCYRAENSIGKIRQSPGWTLRDFHNEFR